MKTYSERIWLNPIDSRSTGSVAVFDGMVDYDYGKGPERTTFLEVSDCHTKIRLHRAPFDTLEMFIEKMTILNQSIERFIDHLKEEKEI